MMLVLYSLVALLVIQIVMNHPSSISSNDDDDDNDDVVYVNACPMDYYCGNLNVVSLSYVEIQPWRFHHNDHPDASVSNTGTGVGPTTPSDSHPNPSPIPPPSLTAAFIKRQLILDTHRALLQMTTNTTTTRNDSSTMVMKDPTIQVIPYTGYPRRRRQTGTEQCSTSTPNSTTTNAITNHTNHHHHDTYLISGSLVRVDSVDNNNNNNNDCCDDTKSEKRYKDSEDTQPPESFVVCWFRTNEPFGPCTDWPCHCVGYYSTTTTNTNNTVHANCPVLVTESTLVVIRNHSNDNDDRYDATLWKDQFIGEMATRYTGTPSGQSPRNDILLLQTQNTTTIAELQFRMRQMITEPVYIGTTEHHDVMRQRSSSPHGGTPSSRQQRIRSFLRSTTTSSNRNMSEIPSDSNTNRHNKTPSSPQSVPKTYNTILRDVALLVHSPNSNDDKVAIIAAIASSNHMKVHILQPSALLLAKYGIYADIALQSMVHSILYQAAVRQEKVCLIWDHFDTILIHPSQQQQSNHQGDAAMPILHCMTLYIQSLLTSIQHDRWIPFPRNHPLYSFNSYSCRGGEMVLPVHFCWVSIVTCPDPRSGSSIFGSNYHDSDSSSSNNNHLTLPGMGLYRLPNLTSETRYRAFHHVFQREGLVLSPELEMKLPTLAAAAIWAHCAILFQQCAQQIRHRIARRHHHYHHNENRTKDTIIEGTESNPIVFLATVDDVQTEFQSMHQHVRGRTNGCDVQFVSDDDGNNSNDPSAINNDNDETLFHSVGGNQEAKASLHDALCFDPIRRNLLASFGIAPSTGLLLYGPPGTGTYIVGR